MSGPSARDAAVGAGRDDERLSLLDELDPGGGGSGADGSYYPQDPPGVDQPPPSGDSYYPNDPPTDQPPVTGPSNAPDVCVSWIVYEVYATGGAGACPECAPFVGNEYREGEGPRPPLHYGCDCYRYPVRWECYSAAGVWLDGGYY